MEEISDFRSGVFNAINRKNNSTGALDKLRYYQKNIYRTSTLPKPYESDTTVFLNDLSSKAINFILSSDMTTVSSELKKEISDIFGKILKGYAKIFAHFISTSYYENFFDSCLKIFEIQNPFYSSTSKMTYFSGVQDSPYYTAVINVILSSNVLDKIANYFSNVQHPEFQLFYFLLCFLRDTNSHFSSNPYKKCLEISSNKIMTICQNLEGNELRDVNERYIHNSLILLNKLNQYTLNDTVANLIVGIDIKFAKSSFLKKRFAGLSTIRSFLNQNVNRKRSICSLLFSEKVLEEILKDFHHQLVNDFVALMSEMIYQNFDERKNLCEFWEVCLNQHSSTIETFFKGLFDLTRTLPEEYMNILYQKIIDTKKYPDCCLSFLCKIVYRMNDNQRSKIYESLERFYFSNDYQPSSEGQIITSMCSFIPSNQFFCQKILEKALTMIENNSHLSLSLNLLMSSCNRIRSEQANRYFDMVTVHISGENSIQFLPLLQQIVFQLNHTLSNDQFNRLLDLTIIHFRSQDIFCVEKICNFYEKLLRNSTNEIFTLEMLKKLFNILCSLDFISFPVNEIIKLLFSDINNYRSYMNAYNTPNSSAPNRSPYITNNNANTGSNFVKRDSYGINDLWRLLFRTKDKYWIKFLVRTESIGNIIFKCMENYQNSASLSTLFYTIHAVEDSINKDILNIPSNIYIDPEDTVMVNVTGELSQCLCVSKYLSYNALLHKIAMILNRKFEYLVFEEDGRSISNRDLRVKDGTTINVRCYYGSTSAKLDELDISRLPSRILMNEKYSSILFGLLHDKMLGQFALKILNEMPTLDKEKIVFEEKKNSSNDDDCHYEFDWNNYLSLDDLLLLNYHLNIIGNNVALGKEEWMRIFFETGGALRVLNLAISEESYECIILNNCGNGYDGQNSPTEVTVDTQKVDEKLNQSQELKENSNIENQNNKEQELEENSNNENQNNKEQKLEENSNIENQNNKEQKLEENSSNGVLNSDTKLSENSSTESINNSDTKLSENLSIKTESSINNNLKLSESSSNNTIHNFLNTSDYNWNINFYLLLLRVARRILESPLEQYTESLIQSFDCKSIPNFSHHIVTVGTQTNNINVLSNMLYILKSLMQHRTLQATEFSNFDSLLNMTLFSPSDKIKRTIFQIMQNVPPNIYQDAFLPLLSKAFKTNCADYFTLLLPVTLETTDPVEIWNKLIDLVMIHFVPAKSLSLLEQLKFVIPSTQLSKGIFNVLNVLVDRIDEQNKEKQRKTNQEVEEIPRISELFHFLVNEILLNTMKYFEITKELVNLLINLLSKKQSLSKEVIMRLKSVREARREIKINSDFKPNMSSRTKYKGLRNLGATCYMASLLQQLFAIPIFRDSLINLSFSLNENEDNEKWLIELQYLFLKMLLFPSCDIDPSSFVKCWKGWDDRPINPREQQDAIEFLQMFLDRIEAKLPITKSLFKGVILHHTDGVDCDFHQNNNEEYVNIPLEVKDHVNVSQSFESYCSPDRFDGPNQYRTDQFGMIDAIQTHRILTPSPQLIITLKRFEYNLSTMLREKVNSEYMFPISLDLSPIMVDNSKPVNYELYGVVVHMGSAQGGHYVSHIKEDDGNWYLFNDRKVTQENQNSMLTASYGGSTTSQIWDEESKTYITTTFDKGSAYLLFYRKSDFDFNAEVQENVSPVLLERLLTEIKSEILKKLESSQEYLRFVSQICVDSQFLLSFFDDSNFSMESLSTLSCKCIENCSNNPSFASEILKSIDQHISVILSDKSTAETRQMYTSILCSAMDFSPIEESKELINRFLIKIRDETDSMMNYYESFPDFFIIFEHYFNRYQDQHATVKTKESLIEEDSMITIWINSISTFISRCLDNDFIIEKANFSIVFNILTLILKYNIEKAPLLKPIHNKRSVRVFLSSKINSDSYTNLLVLLIQQRSLPIEDVYFIIEENDGVFVTSRLFICCLADESNNCEEYRTNLITFCNNKGTDYLISFLIEISSLAKQFKSEISMSFFALSTVWINNWLFHKSKDIRSSILAVFKSFSETPLLNPTETNSKSFYGSVYKSLLSSLPNLKSTTLNLLKLHESYKITSDDLYKQLPTEEFFGLLTWSIKSGSFYTEIAQQGNIFGKLCSCFGGYSSEYPNIHLMDFVYKIVNENNSSEFFKDETLGLFLNGLTKIYYNDSSNELKTTVLGHFIRIIPDERSEELFNTKFFQKVIKYIFVGEIGVIVRNKIKTNIKNLTKPETFGKSVFQSLQCTSALSELCRISWILLKEIPSLSDIFESVGCRQFIWETVMAHIQSIRMSPIVRSATTNLYSSSSHWRHPSPVDLVVFPALKLLGIFNKSYSMTNKDKSSMFWGNYVSWLANQWDKTSIQFTSIFQIAFANTNIEFGQSGPFIFMESLIELPVTKFVNEIYTVSLQFHHPIRNTNTNNNASNSSPLNLGGVVLRSPLKVQKNAARFIVAMFDKIVNSSKAQTEISIYLIDEFMSCIKFYASTLNNNNKNQSNAGLNASSSCSKVANPNTVHKISVEAIDILAVRLADTVKMLVKNDSKKIVKEVNYVLSTANDPMMFGKGMSSLGISLYSIHMDKIQISEWKANATRILSRLLKEFISSSNSQKIESKLIDENDDSRFKNDIFNVLDFMDLIEENTDLKKKNLLLSKEDLNKLMVLLKDKNSDLSIRIINLVQKVLG